MTRTPNLSPRTDIAGLLRDLPVVNDIKDYAAFEFFFETDEEFAEFLRWHEAEREANPARPPVALIVLDPDVTSHIIKGTCRTPSPQSGQASSSQSASSPSVS